jgi:hypothetical protein
MPISTTMMRPTSRRRDDMAVKLDDYMARLPEERREAIRKRTAELIAEEATSRQSQEARERPEADMAEKPHIKQE